MVSPMMVERRWPTCISLATLGDEKSTITRCRVSRGAQVAMPSCSECRRGLTCCCARQCCAGDYVKVIAEYLLRQAQVSMHPPADRQVGMMMSI